MQSEALLLIVGCMYFGGYNGLGGFVFSHHLSDAIFYDEGQDSEILKLQVNKLLGLGYKVELARVAVSPSESVSDL